MKSSVLPAAFWAWRSACSWPTQSASRLFQTSLRIADRAAGPAASSLAMAVAAAISSPSGTQRLISPQDSAVAAGILSPSSIISMARALPTRRGSR
ncbi:hypothetical protein D3C86_1958100 [compost metagenome]